jgi:phosphoglycerate kinase
MRKQTLDDLTSSALNGRRVFVRVDYNVPVADGKVTDDTRIRASLPTLKHLVANRAALVLASHLGRPKAKWKPEFSLAPAADRLRELIDAPVKFVPDIIGDAAQAAVAALRPGEILVLENVRFLPGEEANDPELSAALAAFGDLYVNDAFGTAHRAHATTAGVAEVMKAQGKPAVAGYLIEKGALPQPGALGPERPFTAILGGAGSQASSMSSRSCRRLITAVSGATPTASARSGWRRASRWWKRAHQMARACSRGGRSSCCRLVHRRPVEARPVPRRW